MPPESIVTPRPDPTVATNAAVREAVGGLREILEARLDGQDRATELLQAAADRAPSEVDVKVGNLRDVHEEKFRSIGIQFLERDVRTEQTSRDSKVAVDAALKAAGDAVEKQNAANQLAIAKSEAAFTKQIDLISVQIESAKRAQDSQVADIKERLTRIEGRGQGYTSAWLVAVALVSALAAIGGIVLAALK